LMDERLWPDHSNSLLSIAAGVIATSDSTAAPKNLRSAADKVQCRAKQRSRETMPRPSVIAIKGDGEMMVIQHDAEVDRNPG
jgi:hypothetical protein